MIQALKSRVADWLAPVVRFRKNEDGSSSVEFVILFPVFIVLVATSIEVGLVMTRQVMLERGTDLAVRAIRLGTTSPGPVGAAQITNMICSTASIIPDCVNQVKVEMRPIDPRSLTLIPTVADCRDRDDPAVPAREVTSGTQNQLMVLRVCALIDPFFPTVGLGKRFLVDENGKLVPRTNENGDIMRDANGVPLIKKSGIPLIAYSAFVMEP
ncbi:TadE/TadG family type IV pilus assembly protein [Thalassobium sp. R2A62]|jgi:hypothetical protein|uniref:TadE/TadG family type IV pilus assembly protein n=1 Tax=Thalassobium sp. R2A62 TaxID=633131 RepID=UPI00068092E3|nr:TadE/TadG family type IV pilus assembly protein [Thalassobium sp. R2A62]